MVSKFMVNIKIFETESPKISVFVKHFAPVFTNFKKAIFSVKVTVKFIDLVSFEMASLVDKLFLTLKEKLKCENLTDRHGDSDHKSL